MNDHYNRKNRTSIWLAVIVSDAESVWSCSDSDSDSRVKIKLWLRLRLQLRLRTYINRLISNYPDNFIDRKPAYKRVSKEYLEGKHRTKSLVKMPEIYKLWSMRPPPILEARVNPKTGRGLKQTPLVFFPPKKKTLVVMQKVHRLIIISSFPRVMAKTALKKIHK